MLNQIVHDAMQAIAVAPRGEMLLQRLLERLIGVDVGVLIADRQQSAHRRLDVVARQFLTGRIDVKAMLYR